SLPTVSPDQVQELLSFSAPLRSSRAATRSDELPVSVLKQPWQDWRMSCHSCASGGGLASKSAAQGTQVREESLDLLIRRSDSPPPSWGPIEVVERKGLGHPDSICDAIAEQVCVALCRHYLDRFGEVLHHNVDKVLLCAGAARPAFGGGEMLEPIEIYL